MAAGVLVEGGVPRPASGAEELVDLGGQGAGIAKAMEEVHLLLIGDPWETAVGRRVLCEDFAELAQLETIARASITAQRDSANRAFAPLPQY